MIIKELKSTENLGQESPVRFREVFVCSSSGMNMPGSRTTGSLMTYIRMDSDISYLFPYINAELDHARLKTNPSHMRFTLLDRHCVLYPDSCCATPFYERTQALQFKDHIMKLLNDIQARKDRIIPNHKVFRPTSVIEILKLLPKNNCRGCGFHSCMKFAVMVSQQETNPNLCPYLSSPLTEQAVYPVYNEKGKLESTVTINVESSRMDHNNRKSNKDSIQDESSFVHEEPIRENNNKGSFRQLTDREVEVLKMIAKGETNREIAEKLIISHHTVKSHVIHIFNKLGVNDRTQAAVWAAQNAII